VIRSTLNDFGILYLNQDKLEEAEQMYTRALAEIKKKIAKMRPEYAAPCADQS
jgi:hypothetical protein